VLCRVMHARQKGNDTVSKPNFAVQIIEMSASFCFTLCALPRGAVGMHNTALTVHERALVPPPPRQSCVKAAKKSSATSDGECYESKVHYLS